MTPHQVVVIGQGYVGVPLALRAVEVGFDVVAFDIDTARIECLRMGKSYIDDITDSDLDAAIDTGRYLPTEDSEALTGFDVAVICMPTPLREGLPDVSYIEAAAIVVAPHIRSGACVILESTTYPGTTEDLLTPILEAGSGLRAGTQFFVGYSPERIDPGNQLWRLHNTPKIVAGLDESSLRAVGQFYDRLVERTVPVATLREAELAKLLENTFRHVNIALVNELAMYCHEAGLDVWSVIDAAATKPFGFTKFTPGPGVGGHCLPIDPSFLNWHARQTQGHGLRFIDAADQVNNSMPDYIVSLVTRHLNQQRISVRGSNVLLIGLTYKANSRDARHSPALAVAQKLNRLAADLRAIDPLIDGADVPGYIRLVPCEACEILDVDIVVVLTAMSSTGNCSRPTPIECWTRATVCAHPPHCASDPGAMPSRRPTLAG